jgi:hypothetical protein
MEGPVGFRHWRSGILRAGSPGPETAMAAWRKAPMKSGRMPSRDRRILQEVLTNALSGNKFNRLVKIKKPNFFKTACCGFQSVLPALPEVIE